MNTQSNAVPETLANAQTVAPAAISPTRPMYWSIRRELWEYRSIYIAPVAVAAIAFLGFLIATMGRAFSTSDLARRQAVLEEPYEFAAGLIMVTAMLVAIFYCLDSLYGERRDRSILFWKSLPVSDLTTVLAKASIPYVVLPLFAIAVLFVTESIMLLLSTLALSASGLPVRPFWIETMLLFLTLSYHMITVHVLWHAPLYGWLMFVSSWAKRAPFLWAVLPVIVICALEKIAFNTVHFLGWLQYRLSGPDEFTFPGPHTLPAHVMMHMNLVKFLTTPGLWFGLLLTAAFLAAAVRIRRYRGPM
jgi:ABC-2 type transport system permease protein